MRSCRSRVEAGMVVLSSSERRSDMSIFLGVKEWWLGGEAYDIFVGGDMGWFGLG